MTHHFAGTPYYVAPEVMREGKLSRKADVWGFGVMRKWVEGGAGGGGVGVLVEGVGCGGWWVLLCQEGLIIGWCLLVIY